MPQVKPEIFSQLLLSVLLLYLLEVVFKITLFSRRNLYFRNFFHHVLCFSLSALGRTSFLPPSGKRKPASELIAG